MGPRTFRSKAVDCGDRSVWTDTPADKERKRMVRDGPVTHNSLHFCPSDIKNYRLNLRLKIGVRSLYVRTSRIKKRIEKESLSLISSSRAKVL